MEAPTNGGGLGNLRFLDEILHRAAPLHLLLVFQSRGLGCERDDVGQGGTGHKKEHVKGEKCQLVTCQNYEQVITSEAEMYIISSMAGRSLGNGNRF